jgi:parvulin-like peptidyl-prolyl isomerase
MKYYRAKHILLEDAEDVQYIRDCLTNGAIFDELALEFSECSSAKNGGSLGRFPSGSMAPEFEKALSKMEVGEIKFGIKTKYGHHIILREKE